MNYGKEKHGVNEECQKSESGNSVLIQVEDLQQLLWQMEEAMFMQWNEYGNEPTKEEIDLIKRINVLSGRNADLSRVWWARNRFDK